MKKKITSIILCTLMLTVVSSAAINVDDVTLNQEPILVLVRIDTGEKQVAHPSSRTELVSRETSR